MSVRRDELREQHALGEEIANAITSTSVGEPIDEDELNDELAELEQKELDKTMLATGSVPVSDAVANRLPSVANGKRELPLFLLTLINPPLHLFLAQ